MQALADRTTLAQAHSGPFPWTCLAAAQVLLDAVEMSDLAQDPSATLRSLFTRLVEVASHVGPASRQGDLARMVFNKAPVGHVGVRIAGCSGSSPRSHS